MSTVQATRQEAAKGVPEGYKRTEVGVIPEDWEVVTIGTIFDVWAGGDFDPKNSSSTQGGRYPFPIYANGLNQRGLYGFSSYAKAQTNAITVTARGTLGKAFFRSTPFVAIGRLLVLEPNTDIDPRFFAEYIDSSIHFAVESTGVPQLTAPQIARYFVPLPPKKEQKAIAEALSDVDALIASLDDLIDKKRAVKQATMQQLLTGKTRLPGFEGEWQKQSFQTLVQLRNEKVSPRLMPPSTFCVELEHIQRDSGRLFGHSTAQDTSSTKYRFYKGDVLFGRLRPYLRKHWLAPREGICTTEIWVLTAESTKLVSGFLHALVQTEKFVEATMMSFGTHMPRADWAVIRNLEVATPSLEEQQAIASVLSDMDAEIDALEQRRDKTRAIKQGMMQELLTGKTRLV